MSRKPEDEARIREISRQWLVAAANKDVKTLGEFYAQDGRFMAPNAPAAEGREARRERPGEPFFSCRRWR